MRSADQYLVNRNLDTSWLASLVLRPERRNTQISVPVPWVTKNLTPIAAEYLKLFTGHSHETTTRISLMMT